MPTLHPSGLWEHEYYYNTPEARAERERAHEAGKIAAAEARAEARRQAEEDMRRRKEEAEENMRRWQDEKEEERGRALWRG